MKSIKALALALAVLVFTGCAAVPIGPVSSLLVFTKGPVAMGDPNVRATKVGKAEAEGILIVAFGDASISTASQNGGITKIHHVDSEQFGILEISPFCLPRRVMTRSSLRNAAPSGPIRRSFGSSISRPTTTTRLPSITPVVPYLPPILKPSTTSSTLHCRQSCPRTASSSRATA
ncbi:MAG: hypothetical protein HY716_04995 [Planctomycetes bacterium]|nr:hypothetical protein [Planctomycetota bacterium]